MIIEFKVMVRSVLLFFLMFLPSKAFCQFKAVYIPADKLAAIKLDGDTSDWNWVPEQYHISTHYLNDLLNNNKPDLNGWSCKLIVGWNDDKNWLYILAIVKDDVKSIDRVPPDGEFYFDDCMEVLINPDNLRGVNDNRSMERFFNTIKLHYSFPFKDKNYEMEIFKGPSWLFNETKYLDWGGKEYKSANKRSVITVYEIGVFLWDYWSDEGPDKSIKSKLTVNKKIGLTIGFDDVDSLKDVRTAQWITFSGRNWHYTADEICEFELCAPVRKGISWNNMNYLLKPD